MKPDDTATADSPPPTLALPELHEAILDEPTLDQLFRDIEQFAQISEIVPKFQTGTYVGENSISLPEARELIARMEVRALQIRYTFQESDWWDTLMLTPQGVRLIRIQHHFT